MRICVVGLGKLGLPVASAFRIQGFDVVGVDTNEVLIQSLQDRTFKTDEPDVNLEGIDFRTHVPINCAAAFICVPTPSKSDGSFDDTFVKDAVLNCVEYGITLIVIVSTLMPGQSRKFVERANTSGLYLCYSPTFIALGSVVRDFLNPDVRIIGAASAAEWELLDIVYNKLPPAPIKHMSLESAEIAKLATNCFVTTKIAYANQLQMLCEATPNADVDDVTEAMGMDSRIGPKSLKAGMPFGGPCFPRDNLAMMFNDFETVRETYNFNLEQALWLGTKIPRGNILTLGTSYKIGTTVKSDSPSDAFSSFTKLSDDVRDISKSDVVVIATQDPRWLQGDYRDKIVFDPWGYFKENKVMCKQLITPGRRR